MALTDTFVKNVKPAGSATGEKHADGQGLYLHVKPAGKYWRMSYRHLGKQKTPGDWRVPRSLSSQGPQAP